MQVFRVLGVADVGVTPLGTVGSCRVEACYTWFGNFLFACSANSVQNNGFLWL